MKKEKVNGREIPLTKSGNINKKFLTKMEREIYDELMENEYQNKKALTKKEIEDVFKKLRGN